MSNVHIHRHPSEKLELVVSVAHLDSHPWAIIENLCSPPTKTPVKMNLRLWRFTKFHMLPNIVLSACYGAVCVKKLTKIAVANQELTQCLTTTDGAEF